MSGLAKKIGRFLLLTMISFLFVSRSAALDVHIHYGPYLGMFNSIISDVTWTISEEANFPYWVRMTYIYCSGGQNDSYVDGGEDPPPYPFTAYITLPEPGSTYCRMDDYYEMAYPPWGSINDQDSSYTSIITKL